MKLRFRSNSLRLRVNQREVEQLAAGDALQEQVVFPGETRMAYVLEAVSGETAAASFSNGIIRVAAPQDQVNAWAAGDGIGLYFDLAANGDTLKISIEKDLECLDAPIEERDPHAFPRDNGRNC